MKRNDFPHEDKQTHEGFYTTTSSSKKDNQIGYSGTKPRRRELVLGIPQMSTSKRSRTDPCVQISHGTKFQRYISV